MRDRSLICMTLYKIDDNVYHLIFNTGIFAQFFQNALDCKLRETKTGLIPCCMFGL